MASHHGIPSGRSRPGFTLIEMAIVLVIIGLLAGITLPLIGDLIKREKQSEAGDFLEKVKNEIIGYALINKALPDSLDDIGVGNDPYGQPIEYARASELTSDLCSQSTASLTVDYVDDTGSTTSYDNIGFVLVSRGRNMQAEITPDPVAKTSTTVTYYDVRRYKVDNPGTQDYDDQIEYVSLAFLRNKICTNTANNSYTPQGSDVSFAQNIGDFNSAAVTNPPGQDTGVVTVNTDTGTVSLGNGVNGDGSGNGNVGCLWYQGDNSVGNCADGQCDFSYGFRAYFTFKISPTDSSADSSDVASGFTFAFIDGEDNDSDACGGNARPAYLGYASNDGTYEIVPEKMAAEIDTYPNTGTGANDMNDPISAGNFRNHAALVWWRDGVRDDDNTHTDFGQPAAAAAGSGQRNAEPNDVDAEDDRGVDWDASNVTWLEDSTEHNLRIEVYRNATGAWGGGPAGGDSMVNATVWIDCTSCDDLTTTYNGTSDAYLSQNMTVANNATGALARFRFGWTVGGGTSGYGGTVQTVDLSDFGIKFLDTEPNHGY